MLSGCWPAKAGPLTAVHHCCGKADIWNFLNDAESYGTKKSSGKPKPIFISNELEHQIGFPPKHRTILNPNQGHYCRWVQPKTFRQDLRLKGSNNKQKRPCLLEQYRTDCLNFARGVWTLKGGRKSYSLMGKNTLMVLMVSSVTGMTNRSHLRCFLHATLEGPDILFPSVERCGCLKQYVQMLYPSWLMAIFCVVMNGFYNRTKLQFKMSPGQGTSSRTIPWPSYVFT